MIAKVSPGSRFAPSAEAHNAFVDAAQAHRGRMFDTGAEGLLRWQHPASVKAYNATDASRERGEILGLGAPLQSAIDRLDAFVTGPTFAGEVPTRAAHQYGFGILLDDPGRSSGCRLLVAGLAVCQVDVRALIHPRATIKDNDPSQLESDFWGCAEILTPRTVTSTQWVLVRLGAFGGQKVRGKIAASINQGAAGTVNVWTGKGSAAVVSSPLVTITDAFNPFADLTSTSIFVHVVWCNDGPEIDAAGCD